MVAAMRDDEYIQTRVSFRELPHTHQKRSNNSKKLPAMSSLNNQDYKIDQYCSMQINAFSINWPYVAFSGIHQNLCLLNAFDRDILQRIEISPGHIETQSGVRHTIVATYITDTHDLFLMIYQQRKYYLYNIDLDECNPREFELNMINSMFEQKNPYNLKEHLMVYDEKQVSNKFFTRMHIRGSSQKEQIDFNEELIVLILHENELYCWNNMIQEDGDVNRIELCAYVEQNTFYAKNDSCIFYREQQDDSEDFVKRTKINKLQINFSTFEITNIYSHQSLNDSIKAFNYDNIRNKLIILL